MELSFDVVLCMYVPRHFQPPNFSQVIDIVRRYNFATLISSTAATPMVSHLPFLLESLPSGQYRLLGHMAKANRQWQSFAKNSDVLVVFQGPHAYISPRWYDPKPDNVPTWNYAVVHAHGVAKIISPREDAFAVLAKLVASHDPEWQLTLDEKDRDEMLNEIVCFEVEVQEFEPKFKLSQNRSHNDQHRVISQLISKGRSELEVQTGKLMENVEVKR